VALKFQISMLIFINNLEDASSRDIEELINKVIKEVEAKFKVQLEKEVRILG
jgi:UDP-N-acetylenolpyruvoylglucosamine reductase